MEVLEVDGSFGEGGGQILRTAVTFSVALRRPVRVTRIRSGRDVPGLRQQHASALEILKEVSGGELEGCRVGSKEITFVPGEGGRTRLAFDLKTAASITLVLQALVPAASLSGLQLSLRLVGGTDVPWSPTFDYFATVVRSAFARLGIRFTAVASKRGYYPRGGGAVEVEVQPSNEVRNLLMTESKRRASASLVSRCGSLPEHVAKRQLDSAVSVLQARGVGIESAVSHTEPSDSPGSSLLAFVLTSDRMLGSDSIGARGRRAEEVGTQAAGAFVRLTDAGACLDSNLADMVAPLLTLAKQDSMVRMPEVTKHLETSLHVARLFTGCEFHIEREGASSVLTVKP